MLEKLDQNIEMAEAKKHKLSIHHSNLYYPNPMGITNIAKSQDLTFLAITKEHIQKDSKIPSLTIIEIYQVTPYKNPKLVQRFVEYECLTGIAWLSSKLFLTVSHEQTINIYSLKSGSKIFASMTDYGPIWCMKYSERTKLLLTGTEYGYVAAYRISDDGRTIEPAGKMVKVNDKILSVDLTCLPRETKSAKIDPIKPRKVEPIKPGKRKRNDSSDESDDDNDQEEESGQYLDSWDILIYGASQGNVIVWDYHKKSIIETMHVGDDPCVVCSVLALENGDIVAGDSDGTLSIFDHRTFTCRMSSNVLESAVQSLAQDRRGSSILVSGRDPTIVMMKRDKLEPKNFILVEKFEVHTHDVTAMVFLGTKDFFTASLDGLLTRFHVKKESGKLLEKYTTNTGYHNDIRFADGEMMIQNDRSLAIWKLPKTNIGSPRKNASIQDQLKPTKSLLLKTREYIHSSTFSDRWIAYSTRKGLHIFDRSEEQLKSHHTDRKLPNCDVLEICSNRYLAASAQRCLSIIDLRQDKSKVDDSDTKLIKCIVSSHMVKSNIKQMVYFESMDQLIVACSCPKSYIYLYNLNSGDKNSKLGDYRKLHLSGYDISFVTYNAAIKRDYNLYIYTNDDKMIKLDISTEDVESVFKQKYKQSQSSTTPQLKPQASVAQQQQQQQGDRVAGLPNDANILGMVMISREQCILYDKSRMFKVDLVGNGVINQNSDYNYIVTMNNFLFQKPDQVALVELKPDEYLKLLPPGSKQKRKFGDV